MKLAQSVVQASENLKQALTAETANPRLILAGFRANRASWFFEEIFKRLKAHNGDFIKTTSTMESGLDYGGWFNYFFREAGHVAGNDEAFGRIACLIFELDVRKKNAVSFAGKLPLEPKQSFKVLLSNSPGGVPKDILNFLFRTGFEKARMSDASGVFSKDLALKANVNSGALIRSSKGEYVFGYRGDSRDKETVIAHQDAKCRADLEFWRKANNVEASWHRWKDANDNPAGDMWFRKGSKDNDYFTLNSMAMDFHIACAYPMFRSFEINQELKGPVSGWNVTKRNLLKGNKKKESRSPM